MPEIVLHHYALSPYAEKIRLALGRKSLAWRSVEAPMVMPKPDHVELTGGYRRVPVLQIGADVYCDTHCIARALDRLFPDPPLTPPGQETLEHALSRWAETTFMMGVLALFGIGGVFPEEFVEDRRKTMVPPGMDLAQTPRILPTKLLQIRANLDRLELFGDRQTLAVEMIVQAEESRHLGAGTEAVRVFDPVEKELEAVLRGHVAQARANASQRAGRFDIAQ